MSYKIDKLVNNFEYFYKSCRSLKKKNFYKKLDNKHLKYSLSTKKLINNDLEKFLLNFRDSSLHDDLNCPPQISATHFKILGFFKTLKTFFSKKISGLYGRNYSDSFFDDLDLVYKIGGEKILKKNPVHLTPGCKSFYMINKSSINLRWLRYIYFSTRILNQKILKPNDVWLDIGPYYGGLQSIIKKEKPKVNIFMLDFDYQLCKSYLFLKEMYPNSYHLLPDQITKKKLNNLPKGSFVYIPPEKFGLIDLNKLKLITNFFSFGEMKLKDFSKYFIPIKKSKAKYMYISNRFVSSPWFEKTYDTNLNILNYLNNEFKTLYFDILPLHISLQSKKKMYGKIKLRSQSSNYFEILMKNKI